MSKNCSAQICHCLFCSPQSAMHRWPAFCFISNKGPTSTTTALLFFRYLVQIAGIRRHCHGNNYYTCSIHTHLHAQIHTHTHTHTHASEHLLDTNVDWLIYWFIYFFNISFCRENILRLSILFFDHEIELKKHQALELVKSSEVASAKLWTSICSYMKLVVDHLVHEMTSSF